MSETARRLPAVFLGHGSPMNALGGRYADVWRRLGATLPRPKAVLVISAHWYIDQLAVTAMERPRTIHDFAGFPEPLYRLAYPAPGDPTLAARVAEALSPLPVAQDLHWGLDHGTWSVLRHIWPEADVPVVQLSIDRSRPPSLHYEVGLRLRELRDEGVLVAGSGDVVHNLRTVNFAEDAAPYDWATRFHALVRDRLRDGRRESLIDYQLLGEDAMRSIPTAEHYLPLLYVLGAAYDDEPATFFNDEIDLASVSMLGVIFGDLGGQLDNNEY